MKINDDAIRRKIMRYLKKQGYTKVQIEISQGIVCLQGIVHSFEDYVKIGLWVGQINQVHGIVNRLEYPGKTTLSLQLNCL